MKSYIKKIIHRLGFEIHRFNHASTPFGLFIAGIKYLQIDQVVDVGANTGQFSEELLAGGFSGHILSFEPLSSAHEVLVKKSKRYTNWEVFPRCAIGDVDGEVLINVSRNSVSSSILPMLSSHAIAAPHSAYINQEKTPIYKLDSILPGKIKGFKSVLLKIDTQGFEWKVLDGAIKVLPQIKAIQMELSMVHLYDGQHLWMECIDRLENLGFKLWSLQPAFTDHKTGQTLQFDGLFIRQ
jgi:FkbM family methyltransferase